MAAGLPFYLAWQEEESHGYTHDEITAEAHGKQFGGVW
jgi:hypothetical protein